MAAYPEVRNSGIIIMNDRKAFVEGCKALSINTEPEILEKIDAYVSLLNKWQCKIN